MSGEESKAEKGWEEAGIDMTRLYRHKIFYCVTESVHVH